MKLPSLVKLPKYKRFEFRPRYYDEQKEELQERVQKLKDKYSKEGKDLSYAPNISFERKERKNKFSLNLQVYLVVFMLFDLFLLFKVNDISNQLWGLILLLQVVAVYLKVELGKNKERI